MEELKADVDIAALNEQIEKESALIGLLSNHLAKRIVGQKKMVESLLIGLLGNGHILLEGVPGLAKTLAIKTLSDAVDGSFSRLQFTPDLLPSDLIGTQIYNIETHSFSIKKGPIFANFVLADEINRAPAKVQSALLEAMQERQVTIGDETFALPKPFLVLATQNPVEQEGTYPLPEAQVDRFMLKTIISYPSPSDEREIIRQNMALQQETLQHVVKIEQLIRAREMVRQVYMDEKIEQYIIDIVFATRQPEQYKLPKIKPLISFGASPRGSINLAVAGKARAFIKGRGFVIPEDIRAVSYDVLRHRIGLTYEAEAEDMRTDDIITQVLNTVEVP